MACKSVDNRLSQEGMKYPAVALLLFALSAGNAQARESLGIFDRWGAFRDTESARCYAIAEPAEPSANGRWRAFAAIGYWPRQGVRGQVNFRMSRARAAGAPIELFIDGRGFSLVAGSADAWAADRRADAAIIAALRSGTAMRLVGRDGAGQPFADSYALRGAATAIDAAALGCAHLR